MIGLATALGALSLAGVMLWFDLGVVRRRYRTSMLLAGVSALGLLVYWMRLPVLDTFANLLAPDSGASTISFMAVLAAMASGLWGEDNWNLLWYLLPWVVIVRWHSLPAMSAVLGAAVFVVAGLLMILILFGFTHAGQWAERPTAINRLVMHVVPVALSVLVLLLRGVDMPFMYRHDRTVADDSIPSQARDFGQTSPG